MEQRLPADLRTRPRRGGEASARLHHTHTNIHTHTHTHTHTHVHTRTHTHTVTGKNLFFSTDVESAVRDAEIIFVSVQNVFFLDICRMCSL